MKDKTSEIMVEFVKLIEVVANGKKKVFNFGDDLIFYRGEIHMIKVIGDYPGIYISEMARHFNVTRAVVSKTIMKLERNGFVSKEIDPSNKKLVCLKLTEKGQKAYNENKAFHKKNDTPIFEFLNVLEDKDLDLIKDFLVKANGMVKNNF